MRTAREQYKLAYRYARIYSRYGISEHRAMYDTKCAVSHISNIVTGNAWHTCAKRLDIYITNLFDRLYDRLVARYETRIRADYADLEHNAPDVLEPSEDNDNEKIGRTFIGTVFSVMPSGKYYTAWACSNVNEIEAYKDECFTEALDNVAESFGGWIESGEGDPCDLFFCKSYED